MSWNILTWVPTMHSSRIRAWSSRKVLWSALLEGRKRSRSAFFSIDQCGVTRKPRYCTHCHGDTYVTDALEQLQHKGRSLLYSWCPRIWGLRLRIYWCGVKMLSVLVLSCARTVSNLCGQQ